MKQKENQLEGGGGKHWITTQPYTLNTDHIDKAGWRRGRRYLVVPHADVGPDVVVDDGLLLALRLRTHKSSFFFFGRRRDALQTEYTQEWRPGVDAAVTSSRPVFYNARGPH